MFNNLIFDLDDTIYNYNICYEKGIDSVFNYLSNKFNLNITFLKNNFEKARLYVHKNLKPLW